MKEIASLKANQAVMAATGEALEKIISNKYSFENKHGVFYKTVGLAIGNEVEALTKRVEIRMRNESEVENTDCHKELANGLDAMRRAWEISHGMMSSVEEYKDIADDRFFDRYFVALTQVVEDKVDQLTTICELWSEHTVYDAVREGRDTWLTHVEQIPVNAIPEPSTSEPRH